jgi:hypothetical protein
MKSATQSSMARSGRHVRKPIHQPQPITPGVTMSMVRQHAFEMFRDKLSTKTLTLEDWVLAEKDLVQGMQTDGLLAR